MKTLSGGLASAYDAVNGHPHYQDERLNASGDYYASAVGANGVVVVTGDFRGSVSFGHVTLTSTGPRKDPFVWALDGSSGDTIWAVHAAGPGAEAPAAVAVGPNGEVYAGGGMYGPVTFGGTTLDYQGGGDGWVWRLGADGRTVWVVRVGGPEANYLTGLTVDSAGDVYVAGAFSTSLRLATSIGLVTVSSTGRKDVFVWKVSAAGAGVWLASGGGAEDDTAAAVAPATQGGGVVFRCYFSSGCSFRISSTM